MDYVLDKKKYPLTFLKYFSLKPLKHNHFLSNN